MNRWLGVFSVILLAVTSTGCLRHHTRNDCGQCSNANACNNGQCGGSSGSCGDCNGGGKVGLINRIRGVKGGCQNGCQGDCQGGSCQAGPLGWQRGGLNYGSRLGNALPGNSAAGQQLNNTPFTAGPPTGQVAYPYYSVRGPRDFFVNDPPTIGR